MWKLTSPDDASLNSSLALISARATLSALEVLSLLTASFLYILCQALDLRAMQHEFQQEVDDILRDELVRSFGPHLADIDLNTLLPIVSRQIRRSLESTSTMDVAMRMRTVAAATTTPLVDFCAQHAGLRALDEIVAEIGRQHPFIGSTIMQGHLEARGIHISRTRVQQSLRRVDAIGVLVR